jgi:two-component system LytT family sensor kinase
MKKRGVFLAVNAGFLVLLALLFPQARLPLLLTAFVLIGSLMYFTRPSDVIDHNDRTKATTPKGELRMNTATTSSLTDLLKNVANADGVVLTDANVILAYSGIPWEGFIPGDAIHMDRMLQSIKSGQPQLIRHASQLLRPMGSSLGPYSTGIIVPLQQNDQTTGSLGFFRTDKSNLPSDFIATCQELGRLVCLQMKNTELERQMQLTTEARLDALQAQVNPHFLFNSLNAINMYVLKDPNVTRELIRRLSSFLRYTLGNPDRFTTVGEELNVVQDYLIIEKARFGDRLVLAMDVEEKLKTLKIPILSIQPLVNNAVIHGILPKEGNGLLRIRIQRVYDEVIISVEDNGVGIPEDKRDALFEKGYGTGLGVGIYNVHERLKLLYGNEYGLTYSSVAGQGTRVTFKIPLSLEEGVGNR